MVNAARQRACGALNSVRRRIGEQIRKAVVDALLLAPDGGIESVRQSGVRLFRCSSLDAAVTVLPRQPRPLRSGHMTADSYPFEHAFLARTATRIFDVGKGINRVIYDVTAKPPA